MSAYVHTMFNEVCVCVCVCAGESKVLLLCSVMSAVLFSSKIPLERLDYVRYSGVL
jgi:hypothetical protein